MAKVKGFIVYPTYRIEGNKAFIWLFGRLEDGRSFATKSFFKPYFFIKTSDAEKAKNTIPYAAEPTKLKDIQGNFVSQITCNIPKEVPDLKRMLADAGIGCYEADIRFAYRYLIDNDIHGCVEIEGQEEKRQRTDVFFNEPKIIPAFFIPSVKVLSIDMETDKKAAGLYSVALATKDFKKVLYLGECNHALAESFSFDSLYALLARLKELIIQIDPDIITGWNVIDFDFKFLLDYFKRAGVQFDLGRTNDECRLDIQESYFSDSKADFPGRMILDGIWLCKMSGVKLTDYKLETAASELVGKQKLIKGTARFDEIERLRKEDPTALAEYNIEDAILVLNILEKTKCIELTIRRSMLTRMAPDRIRSSIASLDSLYLLEMRKRGLVAQTTNVLDRDARIKGGYTFESKPGIYEYIAVFDFKSLYPSIIRTFNIDPVSYIGQKDESNGSDTLESNKCDIKDAIVTPNGAMFSREDGILPELIQKLWIQRDDAKKRKDKAESDAVKLLMNSMFGVLANPSCRFYSLNVANAITYSGQYIIRSCAEKMNELGADVIYGDTDSLFVNLYAKDYDSAIAKAKEVQDKIMGFLKNKIMAEYDMVCYLELQFDKIFKKLMMPHIRGQEKGAKKRYAGIMIKDGREEMYFTGLEVVRRDWTDLAKKFQTELLNMIFSEKDIVPYIKQFILDLKAGNYDHMLVYKKAIRKTVENYTKTTPPHIQAARKAGRNATGLMEYVMTTDGPEPADIVKHKIDYEHYAEKQIKPIADSILSLIGKNYDEIIAGSRQKSIFEY